MDLLCIGAGVRFLLAFLLLVLLGTLHALGVGCGQVVEQVAHQGQESYASRDLDAPAQQLDLLLLRESDAHIIIIQTPENAVLQPRIPSPNPPNLPTNPIRIPIPILHPTPYLHPICF